MHNVVMIITGKAHFMCIKGAVIGNTKTLKVYTISTVVHNKHWHLNFWLPETLCQCTLSVMEK